MPQTKADRSAAAKKAAATRKRNEAKDSADSTVDNLVGAAKSAGDAAVQAGKSVASRVRSS